MVKAVIFDMYETLVTHYACPVYFSGEIAADAGIPAERFRELWFPMEADRTVGKLSLEEALKQIMSVCDVYAPSVLEYILARRTEVKRECFRHLHPQILPMLDSLCSQNIKIGLISNCFSEEVPVIRESPVFPYFDAVCLSYEEGLRKPDPEIYRRCMARLDVPPGSCLYIGDGGSGELTAAENLGMKAMQACWYLRPELPQPCGLLEHFDHLQSPLDILDNI